MSLYTTTILSGILLLVVFGLVGWRLRLRRARGPEREQGRSVRDSRDRR